MEKSLMKSTEFASFCGTTRDTILWYDKKGLLKPSVTGENGYRYYSAKQIFDYDIISTFKQTGNTLSEIADFLKSSDYQRLSGVLSSKMDQLSAQIELLQEQKRFLENVNRSVALAMDSTPGKPELVFLEEEHLAVTEVPPGISAAQEAPEEYAREHFLKYHDVPGVYRYPLGTILSADVLNGEIPTLQKYFYQASVGASCPLQVRPAGQYVRIIHQGEYKHTQKTLAAAANFMKSNGLTQIGDIYEYDVLAFFLADNEKNSACMFLLPVQ